MELQLRRAQTSDGYLFQHWPPASKQVEAREEENEFNVLFLYGRGKYDKGVKTVYICASSTNAENMRSRFSAIVYYLNGSFYFLVQNLGLF